MNISTVHETITARLTTLITTGDCSENGIYYISATTTKVTHTHWCSVDLCFEHVSYELKTEAFVMFNVLNKHAVRGRPMFNHGGAKSKLPKILKTLI